MNLNIFCCCFWHQLLEASWWLKILWVGVFSPMSDPSWKTRASLLIWVITFNLTSMGHLTSMCAIGSIALRHIRPHSSPPHTHTHTMSKEICLWRTYVTRTKSVAQIWQSVFCGQGAFQFKCLLKALFSISDEEGEHLIGPYCPVCPLRLILSHADRPVTCI